MNYKDFAEMQETIIAFNIGNAERKKEYYSKPRPQLPISLPPPSFRPMPLFPLSWTLKPLTRNWFRAKYNEWKVKP